MQHVVSNLAAHKTAHVSQRHFTDTGKSRTRKQSQLACESADLEAGTSQRGTQHPWASDGPPHVAVLCFDSAKTSSNNDVVLVCARYVFGKDGLHYWRA